MREVKVKGLREEDDYLADRMQEKINSYLLKGDRQKVFYWILACTAGIGGAAFVTLVQRVEDKIAAERSDTILMRTAPVRNGADQDNP